MCHAFLQDPRFYRLLLHIDADLASEAQSRGCFCGGVLHRADYPRKPRACLIEMRAEFSSRFSFCCNRCRRRTTSMSVRFFGRRVYLALAVVLASTWPAARLAGDLQVPAWTLQRWRLWWRQLFPATPLWQAACARFMPPVDPALFPACLLERFADCAEEALFRLLVFLSPISARPVALNEGR